MTAHSPEHLQHANAYCCSCGYGLGEFTDPEARYAQVVAEMKAGKR